MPPGKAPNNFSIPGYIAYFKEESITDGNQKKQIIGDELVELQRKTAEQELSNKKRVKQTKCSIAFLLLGSLMAAIFFLIALAIY